MSPSEKEIIISNMSKSYGEKSVIKDLNLTIPKYRINAIMGSSGVGKTTILRLIAKLEKLDTGTIEGVCESEIAFMFQENRLLPWANVLENMRAVLTNKGEKKEEINPIINKYLSIVGLENELQTFPKELSGGMKRRLALARTLAFSQHYNKTLLLLDEPFSGIDENFKTNLIKATKTACEGKTLIIITHDEKEATQMEANIINLNPPET